MAIENGFTGNGIHDSDSGIDPMGFSTAEPKPILVIQIADVAHPMPDGIAIGDFVKCIGLGSSHIFVSHNGATNHEFTDFTTRNFADL